MTDGPSDSRPPDAPAAFPAAFEAAPPAYPTEPVEPVEPDGAITAPIELVSTRRLLTVAFELLGRSSEDMRRASFYVGAIVLGTVGPLVLATWAAGVLSIERTMEEVESALGGGAAAALTMAGILALVGLVVATVESRTIAVALLGGRMAGSPVTPRRALARSRRVFWRAVIVGVLVAVPLAIAEQIAQVVVAPVLGSAEQASVLVTLLVTASIGAPFAYALAGVVLGDVDPLEAIRRSFRVFRVRMPAAVLVVTFETIAILLIVLGLTTGADLAVRVLDALGLGPDSGPVGLAVITGVLVIAVFAFGTLVFTVIGIAVAPQVVMFVGLTHATMGLDSVRTGGVDDPDGPPRPGTRAFRTLTRPMLAGFALGAVALAIAVTTLAG